MADKYITLENLETFKQNNDQKYQDKLTTTLINDGTIAKNIGFDNQGNLVKGTAGSGITDYEVINRANSMPTATATSSDFVSYNGSLYQKVVSGSPATYSYELVPDVIFATTQDINNLFGTQVTITFTNSDYTEYWKYTKIYKDYSISNGNLYVNSTDEIGHILGPDGSTTINVNDTFIIVGRGTYQGDIGNITTPTGLTNTGTFDGGSVSHRTGVCSSLSSQGSVFIDNVEEVDPLHLSVYNIYVFRVTTQPNSPVIIDGAWWAN